jgi:aminoglycoside 3-N-acetyltransferase I
MRYDIWELGEGDVRLLRALNAMFAAAFGEADSYDAAPPSEAYLESLLLDAGFIALIARRDGAVIGGLAAYVLRKFERERSEIYLYDLAVAEPFRRRGVATALIGRLQEIAGDRGADVVFVQADRGDAPAMALYGRLGRREAVVHFDIEPR